MGAGDLGAPLFSVDSSWTLATTCDTISVMLRLSGGKGTPLLMRVNIALRPTSAAPIAGEQNIDRRGAATDPDGAADSD